MDFVCKDGGQLAFVVDEAKSRAGGVCKGPVGGCTLPAALPRLLPGGYTGHPRKVLGRRHYKSDPHMNGTLKYDMVVHMNSVSERLWHTIPHDLPRSVHIQWQCALLLHMYIVGLWGNGDWPATRSLPPTKNRVFSQSPPQHLSCMSPVPLSELCKYDLALSCPGRWTGALRLCSTFHSTHWQHGMVLGNTIQGDGV
jgi:hypothetical protein